MIIGYARVSTEDQNLDGQLDALKAAGAEKVFADRITGTARSRPELDRLLDQLRQGDVITHVNGEALPVGTGATERFIARSNAATVPLPW